MRDGVGGTHMVCDAGQHSRDRSGSAQYISSALVHDEKGHQGFDAAWQKLKGLTFYKGAKLLKKYIEHCPIWRPYRR
jgi:hypothetical protein